MGDSEMLEYEICMYILTTLFIATGGWEGRGKPFAISHARGGTFSSQHTHPLCSEATSTPATGNFASLLALVNGWRVELTVGSAYSP